MVAASAGNHGLGLAYAAAVLGAKVTVIVPRLASAAKVAALQQFDVRLVLHGEGYSEAEAHALDLAAAGGGRFVSPYNDPDVIAGQGTLARELLEQVPNLRDRRRAGRGGGLVGRRQPRPRRDGRPGDRSRVGGIALHECGCRRRHDRPHHGGADAGRRTGRESGGGGDNASISLLRQHVEILTVSEADIRAAMAYAAHKMGLVLEGAGAVGVAAVRAGLIAPDEGGRETVVLLTGRNVAPALLEEVLHA